MNLTNAIILVLILVISAIPLNIAVKMLGGKSSILKVILVNILVGVVAAYLSYVLGLFAGLISFVAMLLIYKIMFDIGWLKAFFAWILQGVIVIVFILVLGMLGLVLLL